MSAATTNELVNEALEAWADVVGLEKSQDYDLHRNVEDLNQSRDLDPGGLTTFMLLRGLTDVHFKSTAFTALDLMTDLDRVERSMAPLRKLRSLLEEPAVVELVESFVENIRQAARDYGMKKKHFDALEGLLASRYDLGYVRRDSFLSMRRLQHHQFTQGIADEDDLKKNEYVYEFLNANSAVEAAFSQKISGISVVLVRDPEVEMASYFAFLVRDGQTVTMLTDRDEGPHPAYQKMSRRPDRNLERRAAQHWFPYQLMDLEELPGHRLRVHRTGLVRYDDSPVPLAKVSELEPGQFVWVVLMNDLIRRHYGRGKNKLPQLSYTGEMVVDPGALLGTSSDLVLADHYRPLSAPPLSCDEVTAAKNSDQWDRPSTGFNAWMEERYGRDVPPEVYSVAGDAQRLALADGVKKRFALPSPDAFDLAVSHTLGFEALSLTTFGTAEKLQRDRLWVARVNKMHYVQRLAEEEYEREHEKVYSWWRSACLANADAFLDALARGELAVPHYSTSHPKDSFVRGYSKTTVKNCLFRSFNLKEDFADRVVTGFDCDVALYRQDDREVRCYLTGSEPSVLGIFRPTCPQALAVFANTDVSSLPWPLQHWYSDAPYSGNPILDRVEPSDWVLDNPWIPASGRVRRMIVVVCLSKNAFHARRAKLGLPRHVFKEPKKQG